MSVETYAPSLAASIGRTAEQTVSPAACGLISPHYPDVRFRQPLHAPLASMNNILGYAPLASRGGGNQGNPSYA